MSFSDSLKPGTTRASLGPNAVIGCIKWDKKLGVPNGDLTKAFHVECISYTRIADPVSGETLSMTKFPHIVSKAVGAEDPAHFRVLFFTTSVENDGFGDRVPNNEEKFRHINKVTAIIRQETVWPNNAFTGPGEKVVEPTELDINDKQRNPLRLPDFTVVHKPRLAASGDSASVSP